MSAIEALFSKLDIACRQALVASGQKVREPRTQSQKEFEEFVHADLEIGDVLNPDAVSIEDECREEIGVFRTRSSIANALALVDFELDYLVFVEGTPCRPTRFTLSRKGHVLAEGEVGSKAFSDACSHFDKYDRYTKLSIY